VSISTTKEAEQQAGRVRFARQTTLLAWQRFTLELGVLSAVATRVLVPRLGWWFIAVGVVGVVVALVSLASANRAYRLGRKHLLSAHVRYGMVALAMVALGCAALWWALTA
jgi:hypothetical protein